METYSYHIPGSNDNILILIFFFFLNFQRNVASLTWASLH